MQLIMPPTSAETVHRERIVHWEDPAILAGEALTRPGIEFLQAIADGKLPPPPIAALMDFDVREVAPGRVRFSGEAGEHLMNPIGSVHGGVIATLLDSAMGCAVHTLLPAGSGYTTLELKVNFVRAVFPATGTLIAEGSVVHQGGTIATAEGKLTALDSGKLLAHATTTCLIVKPS